MDAREVIDAYVVEVVRKLPRRQRNDVAYELHALIEEGLQDRAEASAQPLDAAMAIEFLRGFGPPNEVAARYRPTVLVIDPEDGHAFLRAMWIGLVVIWSAGLLARLQQPIHSSADFLRELSHWWGATVIGSLWWPGVLVAGFATSAWVRRHWPQSNEWKPRSRERIQGGRASLVLGMVGIACGLYIVQEPRWVLDFFWGGRAAPAAYQALTYSDEFRQLKAPLLFGAVALNIPLLLMALAKGRWTAPLRRAETVLSLVLCALMAWVASGGPVLMAAASDQFFKGTLVIITALSLIMVAMELYREVRPAPGGQLPAAR